MIVRASGVKGAFVALGASRVGRTCVPCASNNTHTEEGLPWVSPKNSEKILNAPRKLFLLTQDIKITASIVFKVGKIERRQRACVVVCASGVKRTSVVLGVFHVGGISNDSCARNNTDEGRSSLDFGGEF